MATCGYSSYVGGPCGPSAVNPENVECVPVGRLNVKGTLRYI